MELPAWLDIPKIGGLALLLLAVVQYIKSYIPERWVKLAAIGIGILASIACECYIGQAFRIINAVVNGIVAAIFADTVYGFFSAKGGGRFVLPSKSNPQEGGETMKKIVPMMLILLLPAILIGCGSTGSTKQGTSLQEQWNNLTPDQKGRVVVGGMQKQVSTLFDQGKAFIDSNPENEALWQGKVIPAFDVANKALKTALETGKAGQLTPEAVYRDIGPLIQSIVDLLVQMGAVTKAEGEQIMDPIIAHYPPIEAAVPMALITLIIAAINALIGQAFALYSSLKQVAGEEPIPTWDELIDQNRLLQEKIDKEKACDTPV